MMYRWQDGKIVPDATLEEALGYAQVKDVDEWFTQNFPYVLQEIGSENDSLWMQIRRSHRDESCLVEVQLMDFLMLIWCEHWGHMLACAKWLTPLVEQAYRLKHGGAGA